MQETIIGVVKEELTLDISSRKNPYFIKIYLIIVKNYIKFHLIFLHYFKIKKQSEHF